MGSTHPTLANLTRWAATSAKREAAKSGCQFVSASAHHGLRSPKSELLIKPVHPVIGLDNAVFGDVVPDLQDVGLCQRPACYARHLRGSRLGRTAGARFRLHSGGVPLLARATVEALANLAS